MGNNLVKEIVNTICREDMGARAAAKYQADMWTAEGYKYFATVEDYAEAIAAAFCEG